jgi:NADPH-dependent curcumin reductase CurA
MPEQAEFVSEMTAWLQEGKIKAKVDLVDGLENAPRAFQGLLRGENFGKLIVKVAPESAN